MEWPKDSKRKFLRYLQLSLEMRLVLTTKAQLADFGEILL